MAPLMALRRLVMAPLMRGPATRHSTVNRKAKVIASQNNWLGNVVVSKGGKPAALCSAPVDSVVLPSAIGAVLEREQDQERDDQAEQAGRFAQREAEQQVGGLGGGGTRVAQRARQIRAEHVADADTGADQGDTGQARTDHFCSCNFHCNSLLVLSV